MRKSYPSDITLKQFELIKGDLTPAKKKTYPRKYSLHDIFCEVLWESALSDTLEELPPKIWGTSLHEDRNNKAFMYCYVWYKFLWGKK